MKKIILLVFSVSMIMGSAAAVYGADYSDLKSTNWAYEAVNAMSEKTIVKGYPNGSFQPNNTVTYGEFIKMALIAGAGEDPGNAESPNHWARNYYDKALELKYFAGNDINRAQLSQEITRADMALIISSILGDIKIDKYDELQKGITDITAKTAHEYDITKAYAAGILTGYTDKTFKPEKTLTRAEAATVIYRLVDESKRVLPSQKEEQPQTTSGAVTIGKTADLIKNYKTFYAEADAKAKAENWDYLPSDGIKFTEEYELYKDAGAWDIKLFKEWNGTVGAFDHTLFGFIYLVKDGQIVEACTTTPKYNSEGDYLNYQRSAFHIDITEADYIISVPSKSRYDNSGYLMKIVVNPFKK